MSTIAYAAITEKREEAEPGTSTRKASPGVGTYIDAIAALVPAEVLTLHAIIISVTTGTDGKIEGPAQSTLFAAFYGLVGLSLVLYVATRLMQRKWDQKLDYFRMFIPPLAFVCWTMLQRATAFDAAFPRLEASARTVIALFAAVLLGLAASALAFRADQRNPAEVAKGVRGQVKVA